MVISTADHLKKIHKIQSDCWKTDSSEELDRKITGVTSRSNSSRILNDRWIKMSSGGSIIFRSADDSSSSFSSANQDQYFLELETVPDYSIQSLKSSNTGDNRNFLQTVPEFDSPSSSMRKY